jgi:hypothetical protein
MTVVLCCKECDCGAGLQTGLVLAQNVLSLEYFGDIEGGQLWSFLPDSTEASGGSSYDGMARRRSSQADGQAGAGTGHGGASSNSSTGVLSRCTGLLVELFRLEDEEALEDMLLVSVAADLDPETRVDAEP